MSSAVSLQDFSVGEKVWIVDEKSNFNFSIFETTVTKVGRKYVTVDSYNRKYESIPYDQEYLFNKASIGWWSRLFKTKQDAEDFIKKIEVVTELHHTVEKINLYGSGFSLERLQKSLEILKEEP